MSFAVVAENDGEQSEGLDWLGLATDAESKTPHHHLPLPGISGSPHQA